MKTGLVGISIGILGFIIHRWLKGNSEEDHSREVGDDHQLQTNSVPQVVNRPPTPIIRAVGGDHQLQTNSPTPIIREVGGDHQLQTNSVPQVVNRPPTPIIREVGGDHSQQSSKKNTPTYGIPENLLGLLKKNIVPQDLKRPLSPSTYKDYFSFLLYAEDYYIQKWSDFCLSNVTLELHEASVYEKPKKPKNWVENKPLVAFEIDSIPERRPFLLSRDFVLVRPSGENVEPFKGHVNRVLRSTLVLVEFQADFHSQHQQHRKYDVSFSFNRVCLKRCHKAIETAATNPTLLNYIFPTLIAYQNFKEKEGIALQGCPPYLIEGPPSVTFGELSKTGMLIQEMVLRTLTCSQKNRILICAPINLTCDVLMRSLKKQIPESNIFRANAAFRELDGVPDDILSSCSYKGECFACPSLDDLKYFKVIISTFVSSFRLSSEGISSGHFSHIFMLDASSATEPECMVPLANLVSKETVVVVSGTDGNFSGWVRSDIARRFGLQKSYFQRLFEGELYSTHCPTLLTRIR